MITNKRTSIKNRYKNTVNKKCYKNNKKGGNNTLNKKRYKNNKKGCNNTVNKKRYKNNKKGGNNTINYTNYFIKLNIIENYYLIDLYSDEINIDGDDNIEINNLTKYGSAKIELKQINNIYDYNIYILSEFNIFSEHRNKGLCSLFINLIYDKLIISNYDIIFIQHILNIYALKCYYKTLYNKILIDTNDKIISNISDTNSIDESSYKKNILSLIISKNKLYDEFINYLINSNYLNLFNISI
tara:strand:- start:111 stop:836 length:726 start_codon:yes stop_codon:yes gene_type:complete